MANLRLAVFGAGFWPRYQLAAWREIAGVELVAIYNRTRAKAEALARQFGVPAVYDDLAETDARDNIKSARLTFAAYDSAEKGQVVGLWGGHRDRLHEDKRPRQH